MVTNKTVRSWLTSAIFGGLLLGCQPAQDNAQSGQQAPAAMPVKVIVPQLEKVKEWDEFTGRFAASKRVEVKARVGGFIESVAFQDGQVIQKGDVLYELDKRPFAIALSSAEAQLKLAKKEMARGRNLVQKNSISQEQLDERLRQLQVAQANYDQARLDLEFATVVAPISGRIDRTLVNEGNLVAGGNGTGEVLTTIVTINPIHFYFTGSEKTVLTYIRRSINDTEAIKEGEHWPIFIKLQDESDYLHTGEIDFSSNPLDFDSGTLEIRATLNNDNELMQPGMFGRLRISPVPPYPAVTIDDTLVISERAKKFVYIVDDDGIAQRQYIELGGLTEAGKRIVKSGLQPGVKLVAGNLQMIRPGMLLQPVIAEGE
ncbi:MAG: efflux RND transporter periplasmic adaptor subunit [Alteromonadaceae bacterium]|nr:efflux RND transporter periplasmic adaptor subunit [Alteromonadaceae bacterium]